MGQVGHPQPVRRRGAGGPVDQVTRAGGHLGRNGGALDVTARRAGRSQLAHEPLDEAADDRDALPVQGSRRSTRARRTTSSTGRPTWSPRT